MTEYERQPRVLVVEDDDAIAQVLQRSLRMEGYEVRVAEDGISALDLAHGFLPDLVILDLGLPKLDGIEVAKALRNSDDDVPRLVPPPRDAVEPRVEGLDAGADDYLVKPFERQELLARLRALLRRRPPRGQASLTVGDLRLNPDTHEVARGEQTIDLTQREFELLEYLMRNERIVISRQRLLDEVWGYDPFSMTNTIEVFVSNLRRKLEAGGEPRLLHTIRGAGYVLRVWAPADPLAAGGRLRGAHVRDPARVRDDGRRADHAAGARAVQRRGSLGGRRAAGAPAPEMDRGGQAQLQHAISERLRQRRVRADPDLRRLRPADVQAERVRGQAQGSGLRVAGDPELPGAGGHRDLRGARLSRRRTRAGTAAVRRGHAALRAPAVNCGPHARARAADPAVGRAGRHRAGPDRRTRGRAAGDAPDRRAGRCRAGDRAHARPQPANTPPRGR